MAGADDVQVRKGEEALYYCKLPACLPACVPACVTPVCATVDSDGSHCREDFYGACKFHPPEADQGRVRSKMVHFGGAHLHVTAVLPLQMDS